ncbi:MAG: methyl-accepting chemotaxis protein [Proteobacteria bacterium]|nr:methyl-accepting chemotaxis protein [Pseudomonadota bacterium]
MNLTIAKRLQIMIAAAIVGLIILAISGYRVSVNLRGGLEYLDVNTIPSIETIGEINENFLRMRVTVLYHLISKDSAKKTAIEAQIKERQGKIQQLLARYEKELISDAKDKEMLEAAKKSFEGYFSTAALILEKSHADDIDGAEAIMANDSGNLARLTEALQAHQDYNDKLAADFIQASKAADQRGQVIAVVLVALSILGIGSMGFFLLRSIGRALNETRDAVGHIEGQLDFTRRVNVQGSDELGMTAQAINRLLDKMQGNLKTIAGSAQRLAAASNQMATSSEQVSTASQQQSEAASGMAATVEEMAVSINHVADRAQEANQLSSESGRLAVSGEKIIGQTAQEINDIAATVHAAAERIHELEKHSAQIADVIGVIKEVADQTNLLALNAAIEAARAGEQGRGFAVVADEVRKLAERTAASTQEITRTIDAMRTSAGTAVESMQGAVEKVSLGVARANEANESIQQIGSGSRRAVGMVEEITSAIREQGVATNNIGSQVEKIAQMSEQSSAAAAESASAARDLDSLAGEMHRIVAAYRL